MSDRTRHFPASVVHAVADAFKVGSDHPHAIAACSWVAFTAPHKAPHVALDAEALALHYELLSFDQGYWRGLIRLFPMIGLSDP